LPGALPPSSVLACWASMSSALPARKTLRQGAAEPQERDTQMEQAPACGCVPSVARVVVGDDFGDAAGQLLADAEVQELIGAVRVGVGSEHAGDHELRIGEFLAEH